MADIIHFPSGDERNDAEVRAEFAEYLTKQGVAGAIAVQSAKELATEYKEFLQALASVDVKFAGVGEDRRPLLEEAARKFHKAACYAWMKSRLATELRKPLGRR